jgi:hypothetical protein
VILVEALDALNDDGITVDKALEQIFEELVFLQREFVRWNGDGVVFF